MYCFMSSLPPPLFSFFFFFNDTATTEIYTLSLHDALPIFRSRQDDGLALPRRTGAARARARPVCERDVGGHGRSEEHTSELQSLAYLVCRLLLEKKKKQEDVRQVVSRQSRSCYLPRT